MRSCLAPLEAGPGPVLFRRSVCSGNRCSLQGRPNDEKDEFMKTHPQPPETSDLCLSPPFTRSFICLDPLRDPDG